MILECKKKIFRFKKIIAIISCAQSTFISIKRDINIQIGQVCWVSYVHQY
jgi:hypothetical protein